MSSCWLWTPGGASGAGALNPEDVLGPAAIEVLTPVRLAGLSDIVQVAAGWDFGLALDKDGSVWAWGDNSAGQLATGSLTPPESTPQQVPGLSGVTQVAAGGDTGFAVTSNRTLVAWGSNAQGLLGNGSASASGVSASPVQVHGLTGVTQVSTGENDALAIASPSSAVWAWGVNAHGETGTEPTAFPS
jgi:alpha-tubulin suppressor-like RCC1 family protein